MPSIQKNVLSCGGKDVFLFKPDWLDPQLKLLLAYTYYIYALR